jgi:hypothetical protein
VTVECRLLGCGTKGKPFHATESILRAGNGAAGQEIACLYGTLQYMKVKTILFLINYHNKHGSRGSSVSIEMDWTIGVEFLAEARDFSVLPCIQTDSRANPAFDQTGAGASFPGVQ